LSNSFFNYFYNQLKMKIIIVFPPNFDRLHVGCNFATCNINPAKTY
jgi:hypothetical protein